MARRSAPITIKKMKKVRTTKSESFLINSKYMGEEPVFTDKLVANLDYSKHLTWYNYMCNTDDARTYLTEYLNNVNRREEAKRLATVSDTWYPNIAGWIARMRSRGAVLQESSLLFFEKTIKEALTRAKNVEVSEDNVVTVQQKIRDRADEILCEIEGMIDDGVDFDLYEWLKSKEIPTLYVNTIVMKYQPWLNELEMALRGDEAVLEGYKHLSKPQLKARVAFFKKIIQDAERYGNNEKKVRAVRKPRTISVEKKLKHFVFKKEDKEMKLTSINPEKIIGSQELWVYNTKYKTLTVYRALDRGGLQIERSMIKNYDENTSVAKRSGRKAQELVDKILNGGKIVLRKLMDEIKIDAYFTNRVNENTILLRVG